MKYFIIFCLLFAGCECSPHEIEVNAPDASSNVGYSYESEYCVRPLDYEDEYTFKNYPEGPYGFKSSVCLDSSDESAYAVISNGDRVPNFCFLDLQDRKVCMSDFKEMYERSILMFDFSATWCSPCQRAASMHDSIVTHFKTNGLDIKFITVLVSGDGEPGVVDSSEAQAWKTIFEIKEQVYRLDYINDGNYIDKYSFIFKDKWDWEEDRAFPYFVYISSEDYKVMYNRIGWSYDLSNFNKDVTVLNAVNLALYGRL